MAYNGRVNFKFVGAVNRIVAFTFATPHEIKFMASLPFQKNVIYYTYLNNRIYILNNLKVKRALLEYIVADPRQVKDCEQPNVFPDDVEFPLPVDLLTTIKEMVKRQYSQPLKDGQEVNLERDDKE
jgi:hypothetical protein